MSDSTPSELGAWREALVASLDGRWFRDVEVLAETPSTQDEVRSRGTGWIVAARHQTRGRGRLGRTWTQSPAMGVAMSFGIDLTFVEPSRLSLVAGLASCTTIESCGRVEGLVGLRWPNDVVRRSTGEKLSGILVEADRSLAIVGIGINVTHRPGDFGPDVHATSIGAFGSSCTPIEVMTTLVTRLASLLDANASTLLASWSERDVLIGHHHRFRHDGREYSGLVEGIDPTSSIRIRTDDGPVRLPCLTTRLLSKEDV
ncbi:MAG: biotin--[acetyl-CoA-carboxylase] ligase [Phycisphaerales bacterium]|nr:biotin--[acetyl-CoA-carboxylase] ligase [Phycisphaerales bacterium]